MNKTICKKKKIKEIKDPRFKCKKCREVADKKKNLCKPDKI